MHIIKKNKKKNGSIMIFTSVCMLFILLCLTNIMSFQQNQQCYVKINSKASLKEIEIASAKQRLFHMLHNEYLCCKNNKSIDFNSNIYIDDVSYISIHGQGKVAEISYYYNNILYRHKKYNVIYYDNYIEAKEINE